MIHFVLFCFHRLLVVAAIIIDVSTKSMFSFVLSFKAGGLFQIVATYKQMSVSLLYLLVSTSAVIGQFSGPYTLLYGPLKFKVGSVATLL